MLAKALNEEFLHEAENTRKLLNCLTDSCLNYKPQPHLWSTAQLASHIAEVYNWYDGIVNSDVFDMATYKYDKGDITKAKNIIDKFEENVKNATKIMSSLKEETLFDKWKMVMGNSEPLFPEMPRIQVLRGFQFNHLYHHRGELVIHLRASGNNVPSIYGPNYEESKNMGM